MRKIGVITTSRADYSIYFPLLKALQAEGCKFSLYVTGMHFDRRFGQTVRLIEKDGFKIAARVHCPMNTSPVGIASSMGAITAGMARALERTRPEILFVLGDRYEMHAAALAGVALGIPLAHLHGGELSYGSMDEFFRHSLTKLSHLHFVSTKEYALRVIQMGEDPKRVFVCGAPGLDNAVSVPYISMAQLSERFGFDSNRPYILITFHPVTLELSKTSSYIQQLLKALKVGIDDQLIFTAPNADAKSDIIRKAIKQFVKREPKAFYVENFGTEAYVNAMRHAKAMVGNSSSGIIEAASFGLPVVNIGTRQDGRLRSANVIDVGYGVDQISKRIHQSLSVEFKKSLRGIKNIYGSGDAALKIVKVLKNIKPDQLGPKVFYNK